MKSERMLHNKGMDTEPYNNFKCVPFKHVHMMVEGNWIRKTFCSRAMSKSSRNLMKLWIFYVGFFGFHIFGLMVNGRIIAVEG